MAKTVAPLLAWGASGTVAKTQVYSRWKGRSYVRRWLIPANPKTADQTQTREVFAWLQNFAKYLPSGATEAWSLYADNSLITMRNAIIKQNLSALRTQTDLDLITLSPAAGSGLVAEAMTLTAGSGSISAALTAPSLPTGWSISAAWAMAIRDQDPHTGTEYISTAASVSASPYTIDLTGLTASEVYQVGGWFAFTKPDGSAAYGQSLVQQATPTA